MSKDVQNVGNGKTAEIASLSLDILAGDSASWGDNIGTDKCPSRAFQTSLEGAGVNTPIQTQALVVPETNELGVLKPGTYVRVISVNNDPPMTRQADHDNACIHKIMEVYKRSGHLPVVEAQPLEGDLHLADDYMEAQNLVAGVNSHFSLLPVEIRERFGHNPANLLRFASRDENKPLLVELGLAAAPEPAPKAIENPDPERGGEGAKAPS